MGEIDQPPFQIVTEAARCRDHHFGPGLDIAQLVGLAHAAHHHGGADAQALGEWPEGRIDLNGQFARGTEDQDFDGFGAGDGGESFNHRNGERERLAGARLGGGDDIATFQERRDGLGLDGRGRNEFVLSEVVPQGGAKVEFGKMLHQGVCGSSWGQSEPYPFQHSSVRKIHEARQGGRTGRECGHRRT